MKNDILKISGVNFSKSSCVWSVAVAFVGFPGKFKYFKGRMQKESPRGSGNDHSGHSPKLNLEVTKIMKMIIFQISTLSPELVLGSLRDHQKAFRGLKK